MYRSRPIRFLSVEGQTKVYGIAAHAELPRPELVAAAVPAIGCVWELAVTDFERRAWIEHVLKRDDVAAYLAARFEDRV